MNEELNRIGKPLPQKLQILELLSRVGNRGMNTQEIAYQMEKSDGSPGVDTMNVSSHLKAFVANGFVNVGTGVAIYSNRASKFYFITSKGMKFLQDEVKDIGQRYYMKSPNDKDTYFTAVGRNKEEAIAKMEYQVKKFYPYVNNYKKMDVYDKYEDTK